MHQVHAVHAVTVAVIVHPHAVRAAAAQAVRLIRAAASALGLRKPKISVVTPTWQRRRLLTARCMPSVAAQDYGGETEHVIVSDGPDPALAGVPGVTYLDVHVPAPNRGILARLRGTELATGDLIAYLDDDNAWRPDHLRLLADALEEAGADFAYSRALFRNAAGCYWIVGGPEPEFTRIDTSLIVHRAALLDVATWQPSPRPADWDLVSRWLEAGATWVHVPEITLDYWARADPATAAV